ncbi:hypothetical protein Tco_0368018 [Tanacetum coccineum]
MVSNRASCHSFGQDADTFTRVDIEKSDAEVRDVRYVRGNQLNADLVVTESSGSESRSASDATGRDMLQMM